MQHATRSAPGFGEALGTLSIGGMLNDEPVDKFAQFIYFIVYAPIPGSYPYQYPLV